jgi:hypothetical protein
MNMKETNVSNLLYQVWFRTTLQSAVDQVGITPRPAGSQAAGTTTLPKQTVAPSESDASNITKPREIIFTSTPLDLPYPGDGESEATLEDARLLGVDSFVKRSTLSAEPGSSFTVHNLAYTDPKGREVKCNLSVARQCDAESSPLLSDMGATVVVHFQVGDKLHTPYLDGFVSAHAKRPGYTIHGKRNYAQYTAVCLKVGENMRCKKLVGVFIYVYLHGPE